MKSPKRNQDGFITVDFIFATIFTFSFLILFFSLCFTLSVASVAQYITYSAARAYAPAHITVADQERMGTEKFNSFFAVPIFKNLFSKSLFELKDIRFGNFAENKSSGSGFSKSNAANDVFVGAQATFIAHLLEQKIPFLGKTGDEGQFKANFTAFLNREVSEEECREFYKKRMSRILEMSSGSAAGETFKAALPTINPPPPEPNSVWEVQLDNGC